MNFTRLDRTTLETMSANARVVAIGACLRGGDDGPGNPAGMPLFAENVDDIGEIGLRSPRDHVRRGGAVMAHPHVERADEANEKPRSGLVELHRGHPDIHHDAVDRSIPRAAQIPARFEICPRPG